MHERINAGCDCLVISSKAEFPDSHQTEFVCSTNDLYRPLRRNWVMDQKNFETFLGKRFDFLNSLSFGELTKLTVLIEVVTNSLKLIDTRARFRIQK